MKKFLKWSLIISASFVGLLLIVLSSCYFVFYTKYDFDKTKLDVSAFNISLYDDKENIIKDANLINHTSVKLASLPEYVSQCFICTEDKDFYKHHGLDYKRMVKAGLVDLASLRFKQGASTISQQLIKNTHLSNEKTLQRKFKEIVITKKMEKQLSKEEILESYLNCIYFGNNCYGIESAANYYFSKNAKDLTLNQSAVLAGLISAPSKYSPTSNMSKSKTKRDIVLSNLCQMGHISPTQLQEEKNKEIDLNLTKKDMSKINSYSQTAIDEACKILNISPKVLGLAGYKIHTFMDSEKQNNIVKIINDNTPENTELDSSVIVLDAKTGAVSAYAGTGNIKLSNVKRQPGSAIKPVLVYAPALEENKIYPCSIVNDEPINLNGYQPKNVNNDNMGNVSIRTAVNKSLNTVAVKTLSYVGIDNAKYYANKCGITFDESDTNYAIALGGLKYGTTLQEITNSYLPFANNGEYVKSSFVKYITDSSGKIVYINKPNALKVFRDDTAYLMTDMLKGCVKFGTCKKLNVFDYEIAAKTGTVGNNKGNTDAYSISYTTDNIVGVWVGKLDNKPVKELSGGKQPTSIACLVHKSIKEKPSNFVMPSSIEEIEIDMLAMKEDNLILKANTFTPERYKVRELFSKFNEPRMISDNFITVEKPCLVYSNKNGEEILKFEAKDYLEYELFREQNGKADIVLTCCNVSGIQEYKIDKKNKEFQKYYLIAKIKNFADNVEVISNRSDEIKLYYDKNETQSVNQTKWYI